MGRMRVQAKRYLETGDGKDAPVDLLDQPAFVFVVEHRCRARPDSNRASMCLSSSLSFSSVTFMGVYVGEEREVQPQIQH